MDAATERGVFSWNGLIRMTCWLYRVCRHEGRAGFLAPWISLKSLGSSLPALFVFLIAEDLGNSQKIDKGGPGVSHIKFLAGAGRSVY